MTNSIEITGTTILTSKNIVNIKDCDVYVIDSNVISQEIVCIPSDSTITDIEICKNDPAV